MAAPLPEKALSGHCSVIDNNTLYVLSPDSFQALPLAENGTWTSIEMGKAVTGHTCLRAVPNGDESQAALYVVGGTSDDSSYGGLQRYIFSNKTWETIELPTQDMMGRTNHGVAYLSDSSSILVYAGSRTGVELSSQTFVISTEKPFNIESFTSKAPTVSNPILLPWDESSAVLLGGSKSNTGIWSFSKSSSWTRLETNLTSALPDGAKGALVTGTDGSKVLTVYDATASPNKVTQLVLLDADGQPASTGQTIGDSSSTSSSRKRKRDLTLDDWPTYNSSSAPSVKRSDYSVAQNDQGTLAVISGGNDDNPVNVFNQTSNSWVSNEVLFGDSQVPLTTTSASSSTSLPTSTSTQASATSSAAASKSHYDSGAHTRKVLGITLGLLFGLAALLVIALLLVRRRKQKQLKAFSSSGEKSDRMSFQDRGASFMKEAGGGVSEAPPQLPKPVMGSYDPRSSFAILAGKLGADRFSQRFSKYGASEKTPVNSSNNPYADLQPPKNAFGHQTNDSSSSLAIISGKYGNGHNRSNGEKGSFESTAKLVRSPTSPQSFDDPMEMESMNSQTPRSAVTRAPPPQMSSLRVVQNQQREEDMQTKRSSGWSRYFAGGSDHGAYDPAAQHSPNLSASLTASPNLSVSDYTPSRNPSAMVAPLDVEPKGHLHPADAHHHRLSAVGMGRPSFSHSVEDFSARGQSFDMVAGQRADFHTGQSLESQGYLGEARESFASSRRHSSSSVASSQFFSQHDEWTPVDGAGTIATAHATNTAQAVNRKAPNSPAVNEVHIPPSPAVSASAFPRPPSSTYTADVDRDSRMTGFGFSDALGRALSPPAAVAIPGPAARGNSGGGFFPGSGTRAMHDRPAPSAAYAGAARKLGALHPGTLAALRFTPDREAPKPPQAGLGIQNPDENRDSGATIWPSATGALTQRDREEAFRQRLEAERQIKERMDHKNGASRKTQASDISWVDIGQN
ncbi:hypothetical protein E4T42_09568 [Aureobasidium subglaciale]|uniref:Pre-mRNA splicing factor CLF1 n=1 Tax=Aureobasidium subglaciale (strain EXF-2481) TaxID=1043005 RepID=A0A074YJI7_AURSE|nr:uncharacterized protein AUEXF2481DRAFT_5749 [Aureobasidium subglaciale EXF-2481]KAI5213283.1 hypothetical protein E4T40_09861 [Aureobasidium subglaciale]KAI5214584.1 hypothetical protein E4T41_09857 [Aureobasidium subglaciale]KAI5235990.1 hypothetical protein E4T42_09568 [Aureobasidium subglaciale]KAI5263086.1 hypothetical protein E4T46_04028 [Aureobasidium subglaciale]KEQ94252.1 hypothetical protein AUEXF2481DRAFT_5749 [Aureobasidium subglaciale EXF-2481]